MRDYTVDNITEAVVKEYSSKTPDPRMREIITSFIEHMHAFVKDVELTEAEWFEGVQFLTDTGQMCDEKRQEFIGKIRCFGDLRNDAMTGVHPYQVSKLNFRLCAIGVWLASFHGPVSPYPVSSNTSASGSQRTAGQGPETDTSGKISAGRSPCTLDLPFFFVFR